jgi:hypothetical protein
MSAKPSRRTKPTHRERLVWNTGYMNAHAIVEARMGRYNLTMIKLQSVAGTIYQTAEPFPRHFYVPWSTPQREATPQEKAIGVFETKTYLVWVLMRKVVSTRAKVSGITQLFGIDPAVWGEVGVQIHKQITMYWIKHFSVLQHHKYWVIWSLIIALAV